MAALKQLSARLDREALRRSKALDGLHRPAPNGLQRIAQFWPRISALGKDLPRAPTGAGIDARRKAQGARPAPEGG